jgi:hypothetical protein
MSGISATDPVSKIRNFGSENVRYTGVLKANGTNTSNDRVSQKATVGTIACGAEIAVCLDVSFILVVDSLGHRSSKTFTQS